MTDEKAKLDAAEWHSRIAGQFDDRYRTSPTFKERLAIWRQLVAAYVPAGGHVLDAGCGSGVLSVVAAERARSVIGVDGGVEMIRLCEEKKATLGLSNVEFRLLRLENIGELGAAKYDCIVCSSVLEYVSDFWGVVDGLIAKLTVGGTLLFSVPNSASPYRWIERTSFRLTGRPAYLALVRYALTEREITAGLQSRNIRMMETRYYAPTPVLSRLARPLGLDRFSDNLVVFACRMSGSPNEPDLTAGTQ